MRSIDHVVLVTDDLHNTSAFYRKLGFNAAPIGVHPFGTHNVNIYLQNGPMIETLAVEDEGRYLAAIKDGNTFVANDASYRAINGNSGFSHVVLTSSNAEEDHLNFANKGISGGDLVSFSREFVNPSGDLSTVAAKLAFATHPSAPSGLYFSCEDVIVPEIDRTFLLQHENGAERLAGVISQADDMRPYIGFLKDVFDEDSILVGHDCCELTLGNGSACVLSSSRISQMFGQNPMPGETGLHHVGLVIGVKDLSVTERHLESSNVEFLKRNTQIIVDCLCQNGTFLVFIGQDEKPW